MTLDSLTFTESNKPLKIACFLNFNLVNPMSINEISRRHSVVFPNITDSGLFTSLNIDLFLVEYSFFSEDEIEMLIQLRQKSEKAQTFFLIKEGISVNSKFLFHDCIDRIILLESSTTVNLVHFINALTQHKRTGFVKDKVAPNWHNVKKQERKEEEDAIFLKKLHIAIDYNCEKGDISIAIVAETLAVEPSCLVEAIKRITGLTAVTYVLNYRLLSAKILLETTAYRIKEISNRLCFFNMSYFSKRFKQVYGVTPTDYRKQVLKCSKNK